MLAFGVLLILVGVLIGGASLNFGLFVFGPALSLASGLITSGFLLAVAGAIVAAIEREAATTRREIAGYREDFKKGTESLFGQLDRIRANTQPPPPPPGEVVGMGYCPSCRKPRHPSMAKCVYCGNTDVVDPVPVASN